MYVKLCMYIMLLAEFIRTLSLLFFLGLVSGLLSVHYGAF